MDLMEGVEEIPNAVLADGPDLGVGDLSRIPRCAGAPAARHRHRRAGRAPAAARLCHGRPRGAAAKTATPDDIAEMRRLTIEALRGRRLRLHHLAHRFAQDAGRRAGAVAQCGRPTSLLGIGSALGAVGAGAFGMNSDFDDEEYELAWMTQLAKETGRPVWFLLTDRYEDPARWRRLIKAVHEARAKGLSLTAQIAGRPIGVMMGIGTALNPFTVRPSYKQLESLPHRRAAQAPARSRDAPPDPGREAVRSRSRQARAVPPARHQALGQVLRHGRPAGLRAGPGEERRRDRRAAKAARPTRWPTTTSPRPTTGICTSRW